jgi:hypothetical protein
LALIGCTSSTRTTCASGRSRLTSLYLQLNRLRRGTVPKRCHHHSARERIENEFKATSRTAIPPLGLRRVLVMPNCDATRGTPPRHAAIMGAVGRFESRLLQIILHTCAFARLFRRSVERPTAAGYAQFLAEDRSPLARAENLRLMWPGEARQSDHERAWRSRRAYLVLPHLQPRMVGIGRRAVAGTSRRR